MGYISLVLLLALGILMITKPKFLWRLENIFTVKGGEPTELYIAVMQITGTISIIVAMAATVSLLLHAFA